MTLFPSDSADRVAQPPLWQRAWAPPLMLAIIGIALFTWTWQAWPDVLVDFGVQLYVPWRLAAGDVLYRDIAHYTGPLSVYYNALAFRAFGASLRTLEFANLPILIGIIAAIYSLALKLAGRVCALVCGITFLTLFAFARPGVIGNYNYVCPYEYEYTHATLLCLCMMILLWRVLRGRSLKNAAAAGFLLGLIFLTRAEFFVAATAASAAGFILRRAAQLADARRTDRAMLLFVSAAIVPPMLSIALLSLAMPPSTAIRGTLGMWPALVSGRVTSLLFYRHSLGVDDPTHNLALLAKWCGAYLAVLGGLALWSLAAKRHIVLQAIFAALACAILMRQPWSHLSPWARVDFTSMFRPLPVAALVVAVFAAAKAIRRDSGPELRQRAALLAMLAVGSLLLLGKIILSAQIFHYGSLLAMPAAVLLAGVLFGAVPAIIHRRGGKPAIFLAGAAVLLGFTICFYLLSTSVVLRRLPVLVGKEGDEFRADQRGIYVGRAADALDAMLAPDKTVACFPEGIMINYLSRRRTSTPYVNFNPPDLLLFGEDQMVAALRKSPPDCILLVHKDTREFGLPFFGRDYGQAIYAWIIANYREQPLDIDLGAQPLRDNRFGIRMWVRK